MAADIWPNSSQTFRKCIKYGQEAAFINSTKTHYFPLKSSGDQSSTLRGLIYNSHYDPSIGRWTTKDPIGFGGGDTNLYAYVGGNPVSYIDPLGLYTTITLYSNNAGHISVQVANNSPLGFYPSSNPLSSTGRLQDDYYRSGVLRVLILDTTPEQEQIISDYY